MFFIFMRPWILVEWPIGAMFVILDYTVLYELRLFLLESITCLPILLSYNCSLLELTSSHRVIWLGVVTVGCD